MSKAYPAAHSAQRGLASIDGRRALLIQDELDLPQTTSITWGMMTDKTIALAGDQATLSRGGKQLRARILSPQGAVFSSESAYQPPPQNANNGFNRLLVQLPEASGKVRIAVLLSPVWNDGEVLSTDLLPLDQWPTDIEPPPVPGASILINPPSASGIATEPGNAAGSLPLQTIDAIATGPGAISPELLARFEGVHINNSWIDAEGVFFAQSKGLPQTRNYLAFASPGPYGLPSAARFVFDLGSVSDSNSWVLIP